MDGGGLTRSPGSSLTAAEQATLTAVRDRVDQAYAAAAPTYHALAVAHASIDSIAADAELTDAEKIAAIESVQL